MRRLVIKTRHSEDSGSKPIIVVGTKVSKKATERNRIRRQIRVCIKTVTNGKDTKGYTIIATPSSLGATYKELEEEIRNVLCVRTK
jgi:ribonuclease P protein component